MGILKRLRLASRLSKSSDELLDYPKPRGPDRLTALPKPLLSRIFSHVHPHSMDASYDASEDSLLDDACGLCGLRDLTSCALVNRACYMVVQDVLYHSVRIDAVHFCPRERRLADVRRKQRVDPSSIVPTRMRLFQRTAWARPDIAATVRFFKIPYMARESYSLELSRTVAALPNLRHVDLPDGFFKADQSLRILREEVASNCWDLRRMKYCAGAESAFESLIDHPTWRSIEVLELDHVDVDVAMLRKALATLPALSDLVLVGLPRLDDTAFHAVPFVPDFPSLSRLRIESAPGITSSGLSIYASRPEVGSDLRHLSLNGTGATVHSLHRVLAGAWRLRYFSITEVVDQSFPLDPTPPLASSSLMTLNYEIVAADEQTRRNAGLENPYYTYLASSLLSNSLPSLRKLYVRKSDFATTLISTKPPPPDLANLLRLPRQSDEPPFSQPLELFTKGPEDSDWTLSAVGASGAARRPPSGHNQARRAPRGRPVSAYVATTGTAGPQWGGEARKSVIMGNGHGGFLAMPALDDEELVPTVPVVPKAWEDDVAYRTHHASLR